MKSSAVFLDTSILVGQSYNFSSVVLSAFVPVATANGMPLLLSDVTEREVKRHLIALANEALKNLAEARRKAPFLAKWAQYPAERSPSNPWEVRRVAFEAWEQFLKQFEVVRLEYGGIDLTQIMDWITDRHRNAITVRQNKTCQTAMPLRRVGR